MKEKLMSDLNSKIREMMNKPKNEVGVQITDQRIQRLLDVEMSE